MSIIYLKSFSRARVIFHNEDDASRAKDNLHGFMLEENELGVYFTQVESPRKGPVCKQEIAKILTPPSYAKNNRNYVILTIDVRKIFKFVDPLSHVRTKWMAPYQMDCQPAFLFLINLPDTPPLSLITVQHSPTAPACQAVSNFTPCVPTCQLEASYGRIACDQP